MDAVEKQYPQGAARIIIVITTILASLLEMIDTTIVNVSLRHIAGSIGASTTEVAWVITAYAISNVIIIPLSGMLSELFGRKKYFTFSIVLFTLASFMCGNSGSLAEIVIWRFVQGLGGGALLSLSQAILLDSFPPEKINIASVIYGMGVALGPAIGPTLGGLITDNYSWQWIFFVNVPFGILAAISAWFYVDDQQNLEKPKIDWLGILYLTFGIGSLQYVLEEGNSNNWFQSKIIVIFSILAVVGITLLIIRELRVSNPVVNLRLFKYPNLSIGFVLNFVMLATMLIGLYAVPLFVQIDLGWTATMTGLALVPGALVTALGMVISQKLLAKGINPIYLMAGGFVATYIFGWMLMFQSPDSSWWTMFWPLIFRGVSFGLYMLPAITMAVFGFEGSDANQAVGLSNMARSLGGAVGLALIGTQISNTMESSRMMLNADVSQYSPAAMNALTQMNGLLQSNGIDPQSANVASISFMNMQVLKQASMLSYLASFRIMTIVSLIALVALLLLKNKITSSDIVKNKKI